MGFKDVDNTPPRLPEAPAEGTYFHNKMIQIIDIVCEFQMGTLTRYEAIKKIMNILGPMLFTNPITTITVKTKEISLPCH